MARYRTIKPKFYNDRALAGCTIQARYLFKALWVFADDLGVIINEPNWLKSQIFPYDKTLRVDEVVKWLDALVSARMIEPFTFKGESFYNIRSFRTHQKIDRPNFEDVNVPEDELKSILINLRKFINSNSTNNHRTFVDHSAPEKNREEKNREEKNIRAYAGEFSDKSFTLSVPFNSDDFKEKWELWKSYKKKEHKFNYKSIESEQASLNELVKLSNGEENTAIAIIIQSMAKGWKGFFELKSNQNGNSKTAKQSGSEISAQGVYDIFNKGSSKT